MIRLAQEKDINRINELLYQVLDIHAHARPDLFCSNSKKYDDSSLKAIFNDPKRPVFVYEDEHNKIQGYCFCQLTDTRKQNNLVNIKTLYIDDLCVDSQMRNQGIGKKLLDHAQKFAKQIGCYNMTLHAWSLNTNALSFYQNNDWNIQKYVMEKIL